MNCVILQPSYIPWRGYFHQIQKADVFVFYDDVQYDRGGWRNRNRVKTPNGTVWLTIPVAKKGSVESGTPINAMRINWDRPWTKTHWTTIRQAYEKAPFFETYRPVLESIYGRRPELLVDFTIETTIELARLLGIARTRFVRSSELAAEGTKTDRLVSILRQLGATHYVSGPSAREYLEEEKLRQAGIAPEYMTYDYSEYPQLYPPFDPQVSIVDLLMMTGPEAPLRLGKPGEDMMGTKNSPAEAAAARSVDVSIVVPVYRSAGTLGELFRRLSAAMDATGLSYEILFVEDGSPDDSWAILMSLRENSPAHVTAIQLMRNYGQHNAVMCGFRHARGRLIVTLDDDLQNPPEEIPRMIETLRTGGYDLVYGVPRKRHRAWQNVGSEIIQAFYRHVFRTRARISSFRVIRRELVESIFPYALNFTFIDGLLAWNTQRVGQVEVEHHPRQEGRSGYSLSRLLVHAVNIFTNFSLLPLQLVTIGGFVSALCGFAAGIYYLVLYFAKGNFVPGFASIVIAVLVLGGAQLLALGIIGEYLGRLHLNVNRKPQYCVRQVVSTEG